MPKLFKLLALTAVIFLLASCSSRSSSSAGRAQLETDARAALENLYSNSPTARALGGSAAGILVFPTITEGGFLVGGQLGDGVLFQNNRNTGIFRSMSASFGFQAGLHRFGYALFFVSDSDLQHLTSMQGMEIGIGPTVTLIDAGIAASMTTNTIREGIFAFFFDQRGLMGGVRLQGTRISRRR